MPDRSAFRYRVVDVFTTTPLEGNPLAVFPDAAGIDPALMPRIARELNLAETTFVLPATRDDCVARVRIFTPMREMRFAGHPTLGTAFVLLDEGHVPAQASPFLLEELVGAVPVRADAANPPKLWLSTPPIEAGISYDRQVCAQMLGLEQRDLLDAAPQIFSAGNPTLFVALRDRAAVDRAWLDLRGSQQLRGSLPEPICIFVFTPTSNGAYSRMFAPEHGVAEDPATGSATGPLAAFMMRHGLVSRADGTRFVSEQGSKMGRPSQLHVHIRGHEGVDGIEVGGHVTPLVTASMYL